MLKQVQHDEKIRFYLYNREKFANLPKSVYYRPLRGFFDVAHHGTPFFCKIKVFAKNAETLRGEVEY